MTFSRVGNLFSKKTPLNTTPGWEDSLWSATDPNVLLCHEGPRIWSWNVATVWATQCPRERGPEGLVSLASLV